MFRPSRALLEAPVSEKVEIKSGTGSSKPRSSWAPRTSAPSTSQQLRAKTGYVTLDPAFMNTASTKSAITFIDGEKGILRYRGIPIEQLAEQSTFVETAYLLIYGNLPTEPQLAALLEPAHAPLAHPRGHEALLRRLPVRRPSDGGPRGDGRVALAATTRTRSTSRTRSRSTSRSPGSSRRCARSRRSRTRSRSGSRSSTRRTRLKYCGELPQHDVLRSRPSRTRSTRSSRR